MKTFFKLILVSMLVSTSLWSMQVQHAETYSLQSADTVRDDLLFFGNSLDVKGYVQSDVYFFGEEIRFTGHVGDDMLIFGRKAILEGDVDGNVFFFGQILEVKGTVHGSVRAMGQQIKLLPGSHIEGNVYAGGRTIVFDQTVVDGFFRGGAGEVIFNGTIAKGVDFEGGAVEFGKNFRTYGKVLLTVYKQNKNEIANAPANAEITFKSPKPFYKRPIAMWLSISAFVVGLLFVTIFPGVNWEMATIARTEPLKSSGIGALFLLVFPVVALLLIIIPPLALISGALYLTVLYLSKMLGASILGQYILGHWFKKERFNRYVAYILGFVVLLLLGAIPVVGFIVWVIVVMISIGALLQVVWQQYRKGTSEAIVTE